MNKVEVTSLVQQLVAQGEDQDELSYWLDIYDDMPEEQQALLYVNLKQELEALQHN